MPSAYIWLPAAVIALLMLLTPGYLLLRTLESGGGALDILLTLRTLGILLRTALLMALVTLGCVVLGVSLAWLTLRTDLPFRGLFGTLTALPLVIPSYVFALLVIVALGPRGMAQGWLEPLGVDRLPSIFGLPGAVLTLTLLSFPYVMLPVRAALYRVDPAMEEAARSLGRSAVGAFLRVTLPLLRPAIVAGSLLTALYTLSDFGAVSLLRYQTFTWAIFIQYETAFDRSVAAALSLALVALALTLLVLESRSRGHGAYYRVTPGTQRTAIVARLGRWRWLAALYASVVVALSLAAPMAILVYWVVRGVTAGEPLDLLWQNMLNTVYVSALAAGRSRDRRDSHRRAERALPRLAQFAVGASRLRGVRAAGAGGGVGVRLLRRVGADASLPDDVAAGSGVRRAVPSGFAGRDAGGAPPGKPPHRGSRAQPRQNVLPDVPARYAAAAGARGSGGRCDGLPAHDEGAARDAHPEPYRLPHARRRRSGAQRPRRSLRARRCPHCC